MSEHFSIRLGDSTLARLRTRAERKGEAPRPLAQRYVEEGLRRDEHPLIHFVEGPAGRRARLLGSGLDVWEVVATLRDNGGDARETAAYLEVPEALVQAAVGYYGAFTEEIDRWMRANEQESAEAHAAWLAGRSALGR